MEEIQEAQGSPKSTEMGSSSVRNDRTEIQKEIVSFRLRQTEGVAAAMVGEGF